MRQTAPDALSHPKSKYNEADLLGRTSRIGSSRVLTPPFANLFPDHSRDIIGDFSPFGKGGTGGPPTLESGTG